MAQDKSPAPLFPATRKGLRQYYTHNPPCTFSTAPVM